MFWALWRRINEGRAQRENCKGKGGGRGRINILSASLATAASLWGKLDRGNVSGKLTIPIAQKIHFNNEFVNKDLIPSFHA